MRHAITLPDLGTGNEPLCLTGWLAEIGDFILPGDCLAEAVLPGITFDIEADRTGRLVEIVKPVDAAIVSGDVLGWLESDE